MILCVIKIIEKIQYKTIYNTIVVRTFNRTFIVIRVLSFDHHACAFALQKFDKAEQGKIMKFILLFILSISFVFAEPPMQCPTGCVDLYQPVCASYKNEEKSFLNKCRMEVFGCKIGESELLKFIVFKIFILSLLKN